MTGSVFEAYQAQDPDFGRDATLVDASSLYEAFWELEADKSCEIAAQAPIKNPWPLTWIETGEEAIAATAERGFVLYIRDAHGVMPMAGADTHIVDGKLVKTQPFLDSRIAKKSDNLVMGTPGWLPLHEKLLGQVASMTVFLHFVFQMLNCKNVGLQDRPPNETRQQRRARERRGAPLVTFKELVLKLPGGRVAPFREQHSGNASQGRLHLARGHFKTYGPERPLLGRHVGTFWVPAHWRGAVEEGIVSNDYVLQPSR